MHYFIDIKDFKEEIATGCDHSDIVTSGSIKNRIHFVKQKTGYGVKSFFICHNCCTRHTKLYYYHNQYVCRLCYPFNIYKNIQNVPKGGSKYIAYRMYRYAETKGIDLRKGPFNYTQYEVPTNKKSNTWVDHLTVLQALENMRCQSIAFKKRWDIKTVNSVLTMSNTCLYLFDLSEMLDYNNRIFWDKGAAEFPRR